MFLIPEKYMLLIFHVCLHGLSQQTSDKPEVDFKVLFFLDRLFYYPDKKDLGSNLNLSKF